MIHNIDYVVRAIELLDKETILFQKNYAQIRPKTIEFVVGLVELCLNCEFALSKYVQPP